MPYRRAACLVAAALLLGVVPAAHAQSDNPSGLPIPRYVSLKSDRVNVRKGPGTEFPVAWEFQQAGLPVEIIKEYENWRQVRDSEGSEGWVLHSLLSGRRTVLIEPWEAQKAAASGSQPPTASIYDEPSAASAVVAYVEAGALASVFSCDRSWCEISIADRRGFIEQAKLWGVYRDEILE
jgi:SH3-like domain-containing protein